MPSTPARAYADGRDARGDGPDNTVMGGLGPLRDAIVVGLGPAGAATAAMLREPAGFRIAGQALDVLAVDARSVVPTRCRVVGLKAGGLQVIGQADDLLGRAGAQATAPSGVAPIRRIEGAFRELLDRTGTETRYGARITGIDDRGRAGVHVTFEDGTVERARYLVDAPGGRLGPFRWDAPEGETVYLTGHLPRLASDQPFFETAKQVRVHGAANDRTVSPVFGFNDALEGATAFVQFPSLPARADDARAAHRLLRRYLRETGMDPRGLHHAGFIVTPHVRVPSAVDGNLVAVGDTVRRLSPRTAQGVTNALEDARGAAWAIHDAIDGRVPQEQAFSQYALAASRR